jgi:hypothetical protein
LWRKAFYILQSLYGFFIEMGINAFAYQIVK